MGCGSSNSKGAKYNSASVQPAISTHKNNANNDNSKSLDSGVTKENLSPKGSRNKFGLKLDLGIEANGGLDDGLSVTENWMDDFADEVDDDYSDSDEDDTGKGAWQLTSPLSQKKHLHALMKRKSSSGNMTPQSPSLAKLKTAVFKSIVLGQKRVNNYIIVRSLGEGAAGKVKLVEDADTSKLYAMKIQNISVKKTLGQKRDFGANKEIAIMKKLNHPNIVKLYEVMESKKDNKIYMILEYNEQGPVLEVGPNGSCEALNIETARKYIHDVVSGLYYLHHNGIVHQDLKPSNLLLKKNGSVAISDFGVSEKSVGSQGNLLDVAGTPAFQAPELQRASSNDTYISGFAADMWSLGVIVFVFLTGKLPFWGTDSLELANSILYDEIHIPAIITNEKVKKLIHSLLERTISKRLTIKQTILDPWITVDNSEPVIREDLMVNVSNLEINAAIRNINFGNIVKLKTKMGGNLKKIRKKISLKKELRGDSSNKSQKQENINEMDTSLFQNGSSTTQKKPEKFNIEARRIKKVERNFTNSSDGDKFFKIRDSATSYRSIQLPTQSDNLLSIGNIKKKMGSVDSKSTKENDRGGSNGFLKKSKDGNIYNNNNVTNAASSSDDDDWSDGEIHEVTDVLKEIGELEPTKRFTFNMTHERLKTDIKVRNASCLNEILNFAYGNIAEQNRLDYMEDRHVAIVDFVSGTENGEQRSMSYFSVYDGHGGDECAQFLKLSLHDEIHSQECLWKDPTKALKESFKLVQEKFVKYAAEHSIYSGSTACVSLIYPDKYVLANVGDSRAVLSRLGRVVEITVDHKPALQAEMERIHRAGGKITNNRVQGVIAVSRSFGDIEYNYVKEQSWGKSFDDDLIIATPDIFIEKRVPQEDEFLIIASDGLWDAFPSQKVVNMFRKFLVDMKGSIDDALTKIVEEAKLHLKAPDNITVQAVVFNSERGSFTS